MSQERDRFRQVEEAFHRIQALPHAERPAALEEVRASDPDVGREVESLLTHADPPSSARPLTQILQTWVLEPEFDPNIGRKIGPYELLKSLGAGGMGNVYLASQAEPLRRSVAIKLIKRGMDTAETIRRFNNERQVLAALNHPNIARVLDGGATDDGLPYFVMEYVKGEPITVYSERSGLNLLQRIRLFQQVCSAVHFAHQNTVIHRDLKPAHILVTPEGVPKLLDFGIAHITNRELGRQTFDYTRAEYRFLTPEYASPEQVRGGPISTGSDVYSLGVMLYELLTGQRPYEVKGLTKDEIERIICSDEDCLRPSEVVRHGTRSSRHGSKPAEPPDSTAVLPKTRPEQLVRQLKGDLDNIVCTAIRKDPHRRYASAEQFAADLERYLNHQPVLATAPGALYRLRKFARRNRAACGLLAALLIGLVGSLSGAVEALRARDAALVAEHEARDHAERLRRAVYVREMTLAQIDSRDRLMGDLKRRLSGVPGDLRGWEWEYLNATTDDSFQTWSGHEGEVCALDLSPDGRQVASGGKDRTVRIWDAQTGECLRVLRAHQDRVNSVDFSPDGHRLVSGCSDGAVGIWDVETGSVRSSLRGDDTAVLSVCFSPHGDRVATASQNGILRLWDLKSGQPSWINSGYYGAFDTLAFSPDGRLLAVGGDNQTVRIWEVQTGAEVRSLGDFRERVSSLAFSVDGRVLAVATYSAVLRFYETDSWSYIRRMAIRPTSRVAFSPDGRKIACSGNDETTLVILRVDEPAREGRFRGHESKVSAVTFSSDGRRLISASHDGTLKVWDGEPEPVVDALPGHEGPVSCLAITSDSRMIVSGGRDKTLRFWDVEMGIRIRRLVAHEAPVTGVALSSDGRSLASSASDGMVRIWDAETAFLKHSILAHRGGTYAVTFSPEGRLVISGGADATIRLWNRDTGDEAGVRIGHEKSVLAVACSPDGQWIASGGEDATVRIWKSGDESAVRILQGHRDTVRCVVFSPDGRDLVSAGDDGELRIWPIAEGGTARVLTRPQTPILSVAFSPVGRRIASGGADAAMRLYDAESGTETLTFRERGGPFHCVLFSPDGRLLVSCDDSLVRIKDTMTYKDRWQVRQNLPSWINQAGRVVDDLYDRLGDWEQVVTEVRARPDLPEQVRRRALGQILARASKCASPEADWDVIFFDWPPAARADPRQAAERWEAASNGPTAVRLKRRRIDFNWDRRPPADGLRADDFGMVATASLRTAAGRYRFTVISDDGVRLWIDGRKVVDNWRPHEPFTDIADVDLAEGDHPIHIEYYQAHGFARLRFCMDPLDSSRGATASQPGSDSDQ